MTTVVTDSTVLIYLARLDNLRLLDVLFGQVFVPGAVHEEVVEQGQADGYRDALVVDEATDDYLLTARESRRSRRA